MNFNNFTIKAQEAVQEAVNLVQGRGQQTIEPVHVLQGVMKVGENVTNFIFLSQEALCVKYYPKPQVAHCR